MHARRRKAVLCLLALLCSILLFPTAGSSAASPKPLILKQAQNLAVSNSSDITKTSNEILLQEMKYVEAVDGIKAKIKNLTSFRWSPLLSFKFPQQLAMTEEYELNVKPLTLQAEIDTLRHEMNDLRYQAIADASIAFTDVYILQEKIAFNEERLATAESDLARNQARLVTGEAAQSDVDDMQATVDSLTEELANQMRSFQTAKEELSSLIGMDVTSGYTFQNPLQELDLPRSALQSVVDYTLENDQTVYEAQMAASTALMNLESYESLMRNEYGGKFDRIQSFVNIAKNGGDVDYAAFMMAYKEMLTDLDRPWAGSIRILFFRFTKEWFKGEIDGTRYIEDEMYAVYTACMEYANASRELETTLTSTEKNVKSQYELLLNTWKSYESLLGQVETARSQLDKVTALNQQGKAEYQELKDAQESYEELQLEALDTLASYNESLYNFDRLTCGAVSQYMAGTSLSASAGEGGDSYAALDPISDPYYYIYTTVSDLTFHIGVSLPEDFSPAITDFEVWNGQTQIGERTPIEEELTHLTIDYGGDSMLTLRFYDGSTYVTECQVDATVPRDVLPIESDGEAPEEEAAEVQLGSYSVSTSAVGELSTSQLTLDVSRYPDIASYTITYGSSSVFTSDPIGAEEPFSYLTLLISSLDQVEISFYNEAGTLVYTGRFQPSDQTVWGLAAES